MIHNTRVYMHRCSRGDLYNSTYSAKMDESAGAAVPSSLFSLPFPRPPIPSLPLLQASSPAHRNRNSCALRSSTRARARASAGLHNRVIRTDCVRLLESELDSEMRERKCKLKEKERERERENVMQCYGISVPG